MDDSSLCLGMTVAGRRDKDMVPSKELLVTAATGHSWDSLPIHLWEGTSW